MSAVLFVLTWGLVTACSAAVGTIAGGLITIRLMTALLDLGSNARTTTNTRGAGTNPG